MATRRKSTKARPTKARGGRRGVGRRKRGRAAARTRRSAGARQAPAAAAARELRAQQQGERQGGKAPAGAPPGETPALRLADPAAVDESAGSGDAVDREAAELARRIEATVGAAEGTLRTGPDSAAEQLRAHREQMEEAARRREAARELPGVARLGLELAVGTLRLARAVATAPFRIGLAFLRRGEASA
jgi:hypothetical protein